jgi:outer membrane protein assembly factor BamA
MFRKIIVKRVLVLFFFLGTVRLVHAQNEGDTVKLPFAISKEKRLSEEDLKDKKEGSYLTGIPVISSDPVNGFGLGAEGQLFFNGKKPDPFFAFTPYRAQINITAFYTTKAQRELEIEFEIPYIFDTKWRLHGELGYEVDPNQLYFGVTEKSLQAIPKNVAAFYNTYQKKEAIFNFILHRSFLQGRMRLFFGFEMAKASYTSPLNDSSMVHKDALDGTIVGFGDVLIPVFQAGIIFDTRDLEDDPTQGSFAELMNEASPRTLGSVFNFNKLLLHYKYYTRVLPEKFKKVVFAGWAGINYTSGDAPFFEYQDAEGSETTILALGGPQTLRGYVQGRFAAPVMAFTDFELRCRFWQCDVRKQHFAFNLVPFFDAGGVWDNPSRMSHLENLRYSEGLGLRIGWNENTVLRFDYAFSPEGQQFFFGLKQPF